MSKIGRVTDFNPNGQAPGHCKANPMAQGMTGAGSRGGSKPTPQAHRSGSGKLGSSAPKSPQKLRG